MIKKYVLETRPQFLTLALALVVHGSALAAWHGSVHIGRSLLAALALMLLQGSVNVLNDWHDWSRSGIDHATRQTPFSGGSGMLPRGEMSSRNALALGIGTLLAGAAIGVYLSWLAGWPLLVLGVAGALSVVLYTPVFTRIGLGEIMAGLGLGVLPIVGTYYLLTGTLDIAAWVSGIPATLLTYNLLLLNEFPDAEADRAGGRHHMVVLLGKRTARWLYAAVEAGTFVSIVLGVVYGVMTPWVLLGLIAVVPASHAVRVTLQDYESFEALIPAQGANVQAVIGTNILMAAGYVIAAILG
ncbi:MAG: prenyltransferase [Coriobacteriia bacterium]|nr:prenyltransferase [Coriobacteriia bacterium]MBN2839871.1 prenyltransferase [Coriobacteriia bacterium]